MSGAMLEACVCCCCCRRRGCSAPAIVHLKADPTALPTARKTELTADRSSSGSRSLVRACPPCPVNTHCAAIAPHAQSSAVHGDCGIRQPRAHATAVRAATSLPLTTPLACLLLLGRSRRHSPCHAARSYTAIRSHCDLAAAPLRSNRPPFLLCGERPAEGSIVADLFPRASFILQTYI